ncbi:MAG: hypothetical protein DYG88_17100 [Chloroflexi bacterium CFX4]|nr:hypothetical protein [Chloroflexi bacterium CFX4]MDL1924223.1 hypothetical protein [Chloroflexi bacterium CFX3]
MAWSDREWSLEGAAVRISVVGFDDGSQTERLLDGAPVPTINPDLTSSVDITSAKPLRENRGICLRTDEKGGAFDIPDDLAQQMLRAENASGKPNSAVIKRWVNGMDAAGAQRSDADQPL